MGWEQDVRYIPAETRRYRSPRFAVGGDIQKRRGLEHKVAGLSMSSLNLSAVDLGARAHEPLIVDAVGVRLCRRQGKSRYEDNARIAPSSYRTLHVDGEGCHRGKRGV